MRRLDGVSYWVTEDPVEIFEFVNANIGREWESDSKSEGKDPKGSEWLQNLASRKWRLEVVGIDQVKLNEELMHYSDSMTGYDFAARLQERGRVLVRDIKDYERVLPPVILRAEDNQLMDGYCRYSTLKNMGLKNIYAYVGNL